MIFQQQEFQPFVNTRAYFNWNVAIDLWTVTFQKWYPIFSAHGILHGEYCHVEVQHFLLLLFGMMSFVLAFNVVDIYACKNFFPF